MLSKAIWVAAILSVVVQCRCFKDVPASEQFEWLEGFDDKCGPKAIDCTKLHPTIRHICVKNPP